MGHARFWRLAGITGIFVGVRMTFRHLDATFPKYFVRTFGPQAPFEIILAVNPIVEMVGSPIMTGLLMRYNVSLSQTLLWGSFVSGISVFALCIWESYMGAVVFVLILSLGDCIWSPTLYEFSTMSGADGQEGMYMAITMAPMYLAALPVGLMSGWALKTFVPKDGAPEDNRASFMWFIIGMCSFVSPIGLWWFRRRLILPEDEYPAGQAPGELESDGEDGQVRGTRRLRHAGEGEAAADAAAAADKLDPSNADTVIGKPLPRAQDEADNVPFKA